MRCLALCTVAVLVVTPSLSTAASPYDDSFDDNVRGLQWTQIEDNPAALRLAEQNGRLELLATPDGAMSDDAIYLSNGPQGFTMSTAHDFRLEIDYSFTGYTNGASILESTLLVLGVGPDAAGADAAAIALGYGNAGASVISGLGAVIRNGGSDATTPLGSGTPVGTFVVAYDAATDTLSLGDGTTALAVPGTVQELWQAEELLVSFGARGTGFGTVSGEAFLDDFRIVSGTVVPEPGTLALLGLAGLTLCRRPVR